jgi:two-component system heavy metal sensor histidine kinase CusS
MSLKIGPEFFKRFDVRLTAYYTLVCILLFLGIYTFFYFSLKSNLNTQTDSILRDEEHELIQELMSAVEIGQSIETGCRAFLEDVSGRKYFPIYFRVLASSGDIIFQTPGTFEIPFPEDLTSFENRSILHRDAPPVRVHQRPATIGENGPTVFVQLATITTRPEAILDQWFGNALMIVPILLIICIGGGILVSLRPKKIIRSITDVTNRISSRNLEERLEVPDARDEIRDLTVTINQMLDRLAGSFLQIKQFTADVSHELRNPLFALQGELEVALSKERTPDEYSDIIGNCVERIRFLFKMVKDLFMVSSYDANNIPLQLSKIDLGDLLYEIHAFFLPMAQEKKIAFTVMVRDRIVLEVDRTKFLQLLNNLLENAIKFTPVGGCVVLSANTGIGQVAVSVKDSGIGIPPSDLENVFHRFYQVDKSRSDFQAGSGLGLHICKRIAEIHGGAIQVTPNSTQGVTFTVSLPLSNQPQ